MTRNSNFDHLQTPNLLMFGLGIQNDHPPNSLQPPLKDGIHLRWTFPLTFDPTRQVMQSPGFPWHGFYLFRRPSGEPSLWQQIPRFPYPLRLPLTHPDYPCTYRQPEDL